MPTVRVLAILSHWSVMSQKGSAEQSLKNCSYIISYT